MGKVLLHVDLNAFFATAEEIRHPELRGKPLAIGGDGRSGIVSTAIAASRPFRRAPFAATSYFCPRISIITA